METSDFSDNFICIRDEAVNVKYCNSTLSKCALEHSHLANLESTSPFFKHLSLFAFFLAFRSSLTIHQTFQTATRCTNPQQLVTSKKSPFIGRFITKIPPKCFIREFVWENNFKQRKTNIQHFLLFFWGVYLSCFNYFASIFLPEIK